MKISFTVYNVNPTFEFQELILFERNHTIFWISNLKQNSY